MPLPEFDSNGDLPPGVHATKLEEIAQRFGTATPRRQALTIVLQRLHDRVLETGKLLRFLLFGSYVTTKPEPNDIDLVLIMYDDFLPEGYDEETRRNGTV